MADERTDEIGAVDNAIEILEALRGLNGTGVTECSEHVGLSKSTVHRHLTTLRRRDYVRKEDGRYVLGMRWLGFGGNARSREELYWVSKPEVNRLAAETGELALVTTDVGETVMYLYQAHGDDAVVTDSYVGIQLPLHCTATGKAILGYEPANQSDRSDSFASV